MATAKEKLAQLGRQFQPITVTSRDGSQEVPVYYQRPTTLKDRLLREAMREEYTSAVKSFNEPPAPSEAPLRERWAKEFKALGAEKCANFIVAGERASIRADAIRELGEEVLPPDAPQEAQTAWFERFKPVFERLVEENVAAIKDEPIEMLAEKCVDIQVASQANTRAYGIYRINLIVDSLYDKPKADEEKYVPVFDNYKEVEELLAADTIEQLADMIEAEVRKERDLPLNSASTS